MWLPFRCSAYRCCVFFHLDLEGDPKSPASFRGWLSRVNASNHGVDENNVLTTTCQVLFQAPYMTSSLNSSLR